MARNKKIIIVGGGFGGVSAALNLLKSGGKNFQIILIDKNTYHSFTIDYYEVATAVFNENKHPSADDFIQIKNSAAIPFSEIFQNYKEKIKIINDEFAGADFQNKTIRTKSGAVLQYDWLILGLGSEPNFFGIPGLKEKSLQLKSIEDSFNVRNAVDELFERKGKHEIIKIVIGGGGFTGSELAGRLMGYLKYLSETHGHPKENIKVLVVEASKNLLGGASSWTQKSTKKRLEKLGVENLTESPIANIVEKTIMIQNGPTLDYDLLIWTAGVQANNLAGYLKELAIGKKNCVKTDEYLRAVPFKDVFVIGDMAYCLDPKKKTPLPMTAQTAINQGKYVALFIRNRELGNKTAPFKPKKTYFIIPLGNKYALADFGWIKLEGFSGWILGRLATLRYFLSILSLFRALNLWFKGVKIYS